MAKVTPISEHFQHFLGEMKESFWGDLNGQTRLAWQRFFELQSERQRDRVSGWGRYERGARPGRDYRNGYYERDLVTRFGTIRLRIACTRGKSFLPCGELTKLTPDFHQQSSEFHLSWVEVDYWRLFLKGRALASWRPNGVTG